MFLPRRRATGVCSKRSQVPSPRSSSCCAMPLTRCP